jgi:cytochrome P450
LIKIISHRCHEPILYAEPVYRVTRSYYREKKYRKRCYNYLDQVLKERRALITPTNNNSTEASTSRYQRDEETGDVCREQKNFIDQMILREEFSDDEIHDHIYTIIAAGYETIALQTSFTLLLLAMHEDKQEKLHQEIAGLSGKIDRESLEKLKYLDMVLNESMRLLPAVPLVGRKTLEEFELNELVVPSGVTLLINFFSLHRRKDLWGPDAEDFNPERFSKENESQRDSHTFLPFSSGARNCIGKHYATLAMKIFLVKFIRSYKVSTDLKFDELKLKADITLKICADLLVRIEKR